MPAIEREFDYLVPPGWEEDGRAARLRVGTIVRVVLHGRRVRGWVAAVDVDPKPGVHLSELSKLTGEGPTGELIELAEWAAWRWAGSRVTFLRAASPPRVVAGVPDPGARSPVASGPASGLDRAFDAPVTVVRHPPAEDPLPAALTAARLGDALIVVPDHDRARHLAIALRRAGVRTALAPDDWAIAAAGATVVGTRSGVWMPMPALAAVVVVDEHDQALKEERTPSWNARDVALERAARRAVPAVLLSPTPSLEALRSGRLLRPERSVERVGWPRTDILDRRRDDPVRAGLFAEGLVDRLRDDRRVVCVLNRKGRSRLLACGDCGELVRSVDGSAPMIQVDAMLTTPDGEESRPAVCAHCGGTDLRNLRMGVTRARDDLSSLVGEEVDEVTSERADEPTARVVIGTEAVLHRVDAADVVVFLDFDQELMSTGQRTSELALALAGRAARLLGARNRGGLLVLQTRQPEHEVVRAVVAADPSIVAIAERDRRRERGWPPYGAQVLVSGRGAAGFFESFGRPVGVEVLGPIDDRWLLRASAHEPLLDGLAATPRPAERVRVEVDPVRI